jgi:putative FmdB family regulatory protein
MPTYEYRCPNQHDFERFFRKISDALTEAPCPQCGEVGSRRLSAAGLMFKGSGFYLTDYGKNAHRGAAPPDKAAKGGDSAGGGGESGGAKESPWGGSEAPAASPASAKPAAKESAPAAESKPAKPKAEG